MHVCAQRHTEAHAQNTQMHTGAHTGVRLRLMQTLQVDHVRCMSTRELLLHGRFKILDPANGSPFRLRERGLGSKHLGQLLMKLLIYKLAVLGGCQQRVVEIEHQYEAIACHNTLEALIPAMMHLCDDTARASAAEVPMQSGSSQGTLLAGHDQHLPCNAMELNRFSSKTLKKIFDLIQRLEMLMQGFRHIAAVSSCIVASNLVLCM